MKNEMHRIVICVDIKASSIEEAYRNLYLKMGHLDDKDFQWESTDEWFDPEGNIIDPEEISKIRMKIIGNSNK